MDEGDYAFPTQFGGSWWGKALEYGGLGLAAAGMLVPGLDVVEGSALAAEAAEGAEDAATAGKWAARGAKMKKYGGYGFLAGAMAPKSTVPRNTPPPQPPPVSELPAVEGDVLSQAIADGSSGNRVLNPYQ